jgi:hypothetical protein
MEWLSILPFPNDYRAKERWIHGLSEPESNHRKPATPI